MVLGSRADHGRAADVDILDAILERRTARHRGFKRIEVHRNEVDRGDAVLFHLRHMFGHATAAQDSAMHLRHERFYTPIEDFGEAGVLGDIRNRKTGLAYGCRAAGGGF